MIKNFFLLVALTSLLFILLGCTDENLTPTRGRWIDEQLYISDYLGIQFMFPENFDRKGPFIAEWRSDQEEFHPLALNVQGGYTDMFAQKSTGFLFSNPHLSASITFQRLSDEDSELSEIEILEDWLFHRNDMRALYVGQNLENLESFPVESETVTLGGHEWYVINGIYTFYINLAIDRELQRVFNLRRMASIYRGYLRVIFIHSEIPGTFGLEALSFDEFEVMTIDEIFEHFSDINNDSNE